MSYARIAEYLHKEYQLHVCRETICKFLRVRSRNTKFIGGVTDAAPVWPLPVVSTVQPAHTNTVSQEKPVFEFTYSEKYNLKRLPKEEAAAIRKKLEAEGH